MKNSKILYLGLIFIILINGCGDEISPSSPDDNLIKNPTGFTYYAQNSYTDKEKVNLVSNGDIVNLIAVEGGQSDVIPDLTRFSADYTSSVWYYTAENTSARYFDYGNNEQFIEIHNGLPISFYSGNTQLDIGDSNFDIIYCGRAWFGSFYEAVFGFGTFSFKVFPEEFQVLDNYGNYTQLTGTENGGLKLGENFILRFKKWSKSEGGKYEIYRNDSLIYTAVDPETTNLIDFTIGTNSHAFANHFRAVFVKYDGFFSDDENSNIVDSSNELWPIGAIPEYPYLDDAYYIPFFKFNSSTKVWDFGNGNFTGGNGVEGNHTYQWYYWNPEVPGKQDPLDNHLPLQGATSKSLNRNDYAGSGQPFNGHEGDAFNKIFRVTIPHDSDGNLGVPICSQVIADNIQ